MEYTFPLDVLWKENETVTAKYEDMSQISLPLPFALLHTTFDLLVPKAPPPPSPSPGCTKLLQLCPYRPCITLTQPAVP